MHPIENELKDPSQMKSITRTAMCLCSTVYVATILFGYMLFGEWTLDDVPANFNVDMGFITYGALLNDIMRVSYVLHLMLVFSIIFHLFGFLIHVGSTAGRALNSIIQGIIISDDRSCMIRA